MYIDVYVLYDILIYFGQAKQETWLQSIKRFLFHGFSWGYNDR